MTEENKKARKEAKKLTKKRKYFKSVDSRSGFIFSCIIAFIILIIPLFYTSSTLNTLIITVAFDFIFTKYFYNPAKVSHKERIQNDIKKYNVKHSKNLTFDEEHFNRRLEYTVNAIKLFLYCTCIIPSFFYEAFIKKDNFDNLQLRFMSDIWKFFNKLFNSIGKENYTLVAFMAGIIIVFVILFTSKEPKALSALYTEKYESFKGIIDSFEKEDFLYLNKADNAEKNDNQKE